MMPETSRRSLFGLGAAFGAAVAAPKLAEARPSRLVLEQQDSIDRLDDRTKRMIGRLASEQARYVHKDHADAAGMGRAVDLRLARITLSPPPPPVLPMGSTYFGSQDAATKAYVDGQLRHGDLYFNHDVDRHMIFDASSGSWVEAFPSAGSGGSVGCAYDHYYITDYGRTVAVQRRWPTEEA